MCIYIEKIELKYNLIIIFKYWKKSTHNPPGQNLKEKIKHIHKY